MAAASAVSPMLAKVDPALRLSHRVCPAALLAGAAVALLAFAVQRGGKRR